MERWHHPLVSPSESARALARQRAEDRHAAEFKAEWAKIKDKPNDRFLAPISVQERMRTYFFDWNQIRDVVPRINLSTPC